MNMYVPCVSKQRTHVLLLNSHSLAPLNICVKPH